MEPCIRCGSTRRSKATGRCLDCQRAYHQANQVRRSEMAKARYRANPEQKRATNAAWLEKNHERKKAAHDKWAESNRDKLRRISKEWNEKNPDRAKANAAAWYATNSARKKTTSTAWKRAHPEVGRACATAWKKAHPGQTRKHALARRARKLNAPGAYTAKQWADLLASYHGKCVYCGAEAKTMDHIVPLTKDGTNDIENIVPACKSCNSRKHTKSLLVWMLSRWDQVKQRGKK